MKQYFLLTLFICFSITYYTQNDFYIYKNYKGDSIKLEVITNPTVCDCENVNWRNKRQRKICDTIYDYDFMSEEEKSIYDYNLKICNYPSICDCANADIKDKGLLNVCDRFFNYKGISKELFNKNLEEMKKCKDKNNDDFSICDCINTTDYKLKKKCNDTFFNDSLLSDKELKINIIKMKNCIDKNNYKLNVSVCDCALYGRSDVEYRKLCSDKLDKLKNNKLKLIKYLQEMKKCRDLDVLKKYIDNKTNPTSYSKYTICKCNDTNMSESFLEKCNEIWDYNNMKPNEQEAFYYILESCK